MNPVNQRTIGASVTLEGSGVHSGEATRLTFRPSDPGTGILFRRLDLDGAPEIPADLDHVVGTMLGTTLGEGEARILTVEHVMAALGSAWLDNVVLELTGREVPIRDGSFADFVEALHGAGIVDQGVPARRLRLSRAVSARGSEGESYVAAPADGLRISGTIDFDHPAILTQCGSFRVAPEDFRRDIAAARTFGFVYEWDALRERGLALGANAGNTLVLDDADVRNGPLRFPDEFLRHKVGDVVGDLSLVGARLDAHVVAERPSHAGNVALARAIVEHARREGRDAVVDVSRIMRHLPHRYPMLLVDRVVHYEEGRRIVGLKNVTINEPFFQGHYPGHPIMPGVLIIEAMAQAGGLLLMDAVDDPEHKVVYFMSMDNVKWRKPVTPGDTLVFEVEMIQLRKQVCRMRGQGFVEGALVAEADLMARIVDR